MTTDVTITTNPVVVSIVDNRIAVSVQQPAVAVSLSNTGPQGPAGPGTATRMGSVFISAPGNVTIPLVSYAEYPFTIEGIDNLQVSAGGITLSIQKNGEDIPGLSGIEVTTTPQSITATSGNEVEVGDRITLVLSGNAGAANLEFTTKGTI